MFMYKIHRMIKNVCQVPIWAAGFKEQKTLRSLVLLQKLFQLQRLLQELMRTLASLRHLHLI